MADSGQKGNILTFKDHQNIQNFLGTDNFVITPLTGDASSRNYFRITSSGRSYVFMESHDEGCNRNFVTISNILKNEKINVPKFFEDVFLLEDLGDVSLEKFFYKETDKASIAMYKKVIDQLIKIQKIKCNLKCSFDTKKLFEEFIFFKNHFFGKVSKFDKQLEPVFQDISKRLDSKDNCFVHRDFHSKNIMVYNNEPYIIDFQDAMCGIPQYDLVSLLRDSYTKISFEDCLLEYYFENSGFEFSREEFMDIFELQSIQRSLKACGSFKSFDNLKGDKRYLKYIPIGLDYALESLNKFKEYRVLFDIVLELRSEL